MNYDVFISYKKTDDRGDEAKDCTMARNLYLKLTDIGYKVFFSEKSLEDIGSSQYKSDIDDALDGASVMIVVLSRPEYATSRWVEYEWNSFYGDYLSGIRERANLYTLISNFKANELPRTLRGLQSFSYEEGLESMIAHIKSILPRAKHAPQKTITEGGQQTDQRFHVLTGKEITPIDIEQAYHLDTMVYSVDLQVEPSECVKWYNVNPDIYVMIRDIQKNVIIGYTNVAPVTDECYDLFKSGAFKDTGLTSDMILSYDMPFPYSVYFTSVVIHPDYQNSEVFMRLFSAIVDKFLMLGKQGVYVRRMIADAVSINGVKFCKLFGMDKIKDSDHQSSLYEVSMIPPKFRIVSKKTKELYDYYMQKYKEEPYLFGDDI